MMPRDKAVEAGNGFGNAAPVAGDDGAEVFGIEPRGERSRSDQVTKQYRKLPALDRARVPCRRYHRERIHAQFGPAVAANLFWARFAAPQTRQRRTTAAPHCPQNFFCSGTSAAQFVHCIRTSTEMATSPLWRLKRRKTVRANQNNLGKHTSPKSHCGPPQVISFSP